jgi:C4-type Zn-finger protein
MQADERAFLEEMIESAELLDCAECGEDTLHAHEEVVSVAGRVTEVVMRCTSCMSYRPHLLVD